MRDAIMLTIQKKWCDKILSGEKKLEIRKNCPGFKALEPDSRPEFNVILYESKTDGGSGMVVGKAVMTEPFVIEKYDEQVGRLSCLTEEEFDAYAEGGEVYGWPMLGARRFDKPLTLESYEIKTPPQSWRYIGAPQHIAREEVLSPETLFEQEKTIRLETEPFGVCPYCGQIRFYNKDCRLDQAGRNEDTARRCSCPAGFAYRQARELEERREMEIERAAIQISALFGDGAEANGREPCTDDQIDYLNYTAEQVIRRIIAKASVNLTRGIKADISVNGKGVTTITRSESHSDKVEV